MSDSSLSIRVANPNVGANAHRRRVCRSARMSFKLALNCKHAAAARLTVPLTLLPRADGVIQ